LENDINNINTSFEEEEDEEDENSINKLDDKNLFGSGYEFNHNYKNEIYKIEKRQLKKVIKLA